MDTQTKTTTKTPAVGPAPANKCPECGQIDQVHLVNCTIGKQHREAQARLEAANKAAAVVKTPVELKEAPYSWNVYARDAEGWSEQFTIREIDSKAFIDKIAGIKEYFRAHSYTPEERGKGKASAPAASPTGGTAPAVEGEVIPNCAIHHKPLVKRSKDNKSWWSCNTKLDDGTWCPYRPPSK